MGRVPAFLQQLGPLGILVVPDGESEDRVGSYVTRASTTIVQEKEDDDDNDLLDEWGHLPTVTNPFKKRTCC